MQLCWQSYFELGPLVECKAVYCDKVHPLFGLHSISVPSSTTAFEILWILFKPTILLLDAPRWLPLIQNSSKIFNFIPSLVMSYFWLSAPRSESVDFFCCRTTGTSWEWWCWWWRWGRRRWWVTEIRYRGSFFVWKWQRKVGFSLGINKTFHS